MKKAPKPAQRSKNLVFTLIFTALVLALPFVLEGILRLAGTGIDTSPFVHPQGYSDVWVDNPEAYQKYYPKMASREGLDLVKPNIFDSEKVPGTLRGFILGGSTAQGFPYLANQSFAKIAEASFRGGEKTFEILNLGRSAMSSYYVRDMASKLMDYDPDFLVIYAGHNDYYGTISASTGGNHLLRLLNLKLKEWRLFQLLFDLLAPTPPAPQEGQTRMAQQFADRTFLPDPVLDAQVAADFVDNIRAASRPFLDKGLPVFLYLPVSNLEMPPFNSDRQGTFQTLLQEAGAQALRDRAAWEAADLRLVEAGAGDNGHRLYLKARAEAGPGAWNWQGLEEAKDRDTSPFRARSALIRALKTWAQGEKGVVLIDTPSEFTREGATFTKDFFIDHLHFNFAGQKLAGKLLSRALADHYGVPEGSREIMENFYREPGMPEKAVHLTEYFSWRAVTGVEKLVAAPPYKFMILPGDFGLDELKKGNLLFENPEVRDGLASVPSADQFSRLLSWYSSQGLTDKLSANLIGLAAADRGNPQPPKMLAELYERSPDPRLQARAGEFYLRAYLLSGRDPVLFDRMRRVLQNTGQGDLYRRIAQQYPLLP